MRWFKRKPRVIEEHHHFYEWVWLYSGRWVQECTCGQRLQIP